MCIRRYRLQALVLYGAAHAEVIKALKLVALQAEQSVAVVVEVAADPGGAKAGGLQDRLHGRHGCSPFATCLGANWTPAGALRVQSLGQLVAEGE